MNEKQTQITLTESENGFRIEVKGKSLKEMFSCCCLPLVACRSEVKTDCCSPEEEKK
jgi:regulation of enolase protein 1 (concanavalin A-like superfamily)